MVPYIFQLRHVLVYTVCIFHVQYQYTTPMLTSSGKCFIAGQVQIVSI